MPKVSAVVPIRVAPKDGVDGYTYETVDEAFGNGASSTSHADVQWGVDPANGKYRWRRFKTCKKQGETVVSVSEFHYECVGYVGVNGQTKYMWTMYADEEPSASTEIYDQPRETTKYIGIAYNKDISEEQATESERKNYLNYRWTKYVGEDGATGPQGPNGYNTATISVYKIVDESDTLPSKPTIVGVYNFATKTFNSTSMQGWSLVQPSAEQGKMVCMSAQTVSSQAATATTTPNGWAGTVRLGYNGIDGVGAYIVDLSNENANIGLAKVGDEYHVAAGYNTADTYINPGGGSSTPPFKSITATFTAMEAGESVTKSITVTQTDTHKMEGVDGDFTIDLDLYADKQYKQGHIYAAFRPDKARTQGEKLIVNVSAVLDVDDAGGEREVTVANTFSCLMQPPGADGVTPTIYELNPSQQVVVCHVANNTFDPSTVSCSVTKRYGNTKTVYNDNASLAVEGMKMQYKTSEAGAWTDGNNVDITYPYLKFRLVKIEGGEVVDTETVSFAEDSKFLIAPVSLYKRQAAKPVYEAGEYPHGTLDYDFETNLLFETEGASFNGWAQDIPDGSQQCWEIHATAVGPINGDDLIEDGEWSEAAAFVKDGEPGQQGPSGANGQSVLTSYLFRRSDTKPTVLPYPSQGSYTQPSPPSGQTWNGWSDGIREGNAPLWQTHRVFTSDGKTPQQTAWQPASLVADSQDMDVCFNASETQPEPPTKHGTQTGEWHETAAPEDNWMATAFKKEGAWGAWNISRIKGENGDSAYTFFLSMESGVFPIDPETGMTAWSHFDFTVQVKQGTEAKVISIAPIQHHSPFENWSISSSEDGKTWTISGDMPAGLSIESGLFNINITVDQVLYTKTWQWVTSGQGEKGDGAPIITADKIVLETEDSGEVILQDAFATLKGTVGGEEATVSINGFPQKYPSSGFDVSRSGNTEVEIVSFEYDYYDENGNKITSKVTGGYQIPKVVTGYIFGTATLTCGGKTFTNVPYEAPFEVSVHANWVTTMSNRQMIYQQIGEVEGEVTTLNTRVDRADVSIQTLEQKTEGQGEQISTIQQTVDNISLKVGTRPAVDVRPNLVPDSYSNDVFKTEQRQSGGSFFLQGGHTYIFSTMGRLKDSLPEGVTGASSWFGGGIYNYYNIISHKTNRVYCCVLKPEADASYSIQHVPSKPTKIETNIVWDKVEDVTNELPDGFWSWPEEEGGSEKRQAWAESAATTWSPNEADRVLYTESEWTQWVPFEKADTELGDNVKATRVVLTKKSGSAQCSEVGDFYISGGLHVYKGNNEWHEQSDTDYLDIFIPKQQTLTVKKGKRYTYTFWAKAIGGYTSTPIVCYLGDMDYNAVYNNDGTMFYHNGTPQTPIVGNDWVKHSFTFSGITAEQSPSYYFPCRVPGLNNLAVNSSIGVYLASALLEESGGAPYSSIEQALLDTGIDIYNRKVVVTADNFLVQNNDGEQTMAVDADGTLAAGSLTNIDSSGGMIDIANGNIVLSDDDYKKVQLGYNPFSGEPQLEFFEKINIPLTTDTALEPIMVIDKCGVKYFDRNVSITATLGVANAKHILVTPFDFGTMASIYETAGLTIMPYSDGRHDRVYAMIMEIDWKTLIFNNTNRASWWNSSVPSYRFAAAILNGDIVVGSGYTIEGQGPTLEDAKKYNGMFVKVDNWTNVLGLLGTQITGEPTEDCCFMMEYAQLTDADKKKVYPSQRDRFFNERNPSDYGIDFSKPVYCSKMYFVSSGVLVDHWTFYSNTLYQ